MPAAKDKARLPWFKFWADAYYSGTGGWPYDVKGMYVDLMCLQWERGPLPKQPERIAGMLRVPWHEFEEIWTEYLSEKFPPTGNGEKRANRKLLNMRKDQEATHKKRVEAGRKGGASTSTQQSRFAAGSEQVPLSSGDLQTEADQQDTKPGLSPATSQAIQKSEVRSNKEHLGSTNRRGELEGRPKTQTAKRFEEWWTHYPRKIGKKTALQKWKARNLDDKADTIIADTIRRAANHAPWLKGQEFVPHPTTYINGDRWDDEIERPDPLARQPQVDHRTKAEIRDDKLRRNAEYLEALADEEDRQRAAHARAERNPTSCDLDPLVAPNAGKLREQVVILAAHRGGKADDR